MNIQYVEFQMYNKVAYGVCNVAAVYSEIYILIRSWEAENTRKMNLLAIL